MSIAENIALDVADLPTEVFEVEGPARHDRGNGSDRRNGHAASIAVDHGIDGGTPPSSAAASHPLLDGP